LYLLGLAAALPTEPLDGEISSTFSNLNKLTKARKYLLSANTDKKDSSNLLSIPELVEPQDYELGRFIPKFTLHTNRTISALEFIALKPLAIYKNGLSQGIISIYTDGILEIHDLIGELLYRHNLGYSATLIAATSNFDDIKFALISPEDKLVIFTVKIDKAKNSPFTPIEFGNQTHKMSIEIKKEAESPLYQSAKATCILHYIKSGQKNWVVGDSLGGVSFHHMNGTWLKRTESLGYPITSLDRLGPQLVFSAGDSIAVLNTHTMALTHRCEGPAGIITDIAIDQMSGTIIYALLDSKDVLVFETRHQQKNEYVCKNIGRIHSPTSNDKYRMNVIKDYLAVLGSNGELSLYDSTLLSKGIHIHPTQMTISKKNINPLFRTLKLQTYGSVMIFAVENDIAVYEIIQPKVPESWDMGNIRTIGIVLAVLGAILWQYFKKGKKPTPSASRKSKKNDPPFTKRRR